MLTDDSGALERVDPRGEKRRLAVGGDGPGLAGEREHPIRAIYLLLRDRKVTDISISPLGPAEALYHLAQQTSLAALMPAFPDLQPHRLSVLAALAQQARICRLRVPDGLSRLPAVRRAILADLHNSDLDNSDADNAHRDR
jgi:hypothetical protein